MSVKISNLLQAPSIAQASSRVGESALQSNRTLNVTTNTSIKDFHVHKKIGRLFKWPYCLTLGDGAYSQVFQVTRKSDHKEYALK